MLDDLKYIHEKDAEDALGIAGKSAEQLTYTYELPELAFDVENVVLAGMGGSALGAEMARTWPGVTVPFEICKNYDIPAYVGPNTLFLASSYSGNTEETLSALTQAEAKGAHIVILAAGGKLADIARDKQLPIALLPNVGQPRFAAFYSFKTLVSILAKVGVAAAQNIDEELQAVADFLSKESENWRSEVPAVRNYAKQLAQEIMGRSLVIYAGPKLAPAAYKWKISFNESAKNVAWWNSYPEFNHNEFIGWSSHPEQKPYAVIDLRSNLEHPRIQKRFEVSDRLLSGKRPAALVVDVRGETLLQQLIWTISLGDHVSLYLGLLNGQNPTPVDLVEKLKKSLDD